MDTTILYRAIQGKCMDVTAALLYWLGDRGDEEGLSCYRIDASIPC